MGGSRNFWLVLALMMLMILIALAFAAIGVWFYTSGG